MSFKSLLYPVIDDGITVLKSFNPSEARDHGKWTSGSSSAAQSSEDAHKRTQSLIGGMKESKDALKESSAATSHAKNGKHQEAAEAHLRAADAIAKIGDINHPNAGRLFSASLAHHAAASKNQMEHASSHAEKMSENAKQTPSLANHQSAQDAHLRASESHDSESKEHKYHQKMAKEHGDTASKIRRSRQ